MVIQMDSNTATVTVLSVALLAALVGILAYRHCKAASKRSDDIPADKHDKSGSNWSDNILGMYKSARDQLTGGKEGNFALEVNPFKTHVVVDFETANLTRSWDSVASVGLALVIDGKIIETTHTLARPRVRVDAGASRVNGLTDDILSDELDVEYVLGVLCIMLKMGLPIVSYNNFDLEILSSFNAHSEQGGLQGVPLHIDAMLLATEVYTPGRKWLKLAEACDIAGVSLTNAHNAEADARATAQLMSELFKVIANDDADRIEVEHSMSHQPFL